MMDRAVLRAEVEKIDTLPTVPSILAKLLPLIENPNTSLQEIGDFILKDPVLTTRVLKMVNSPLYGFPGKIASIRQALMILGLNVIKGLILGVSVFELMQKAMRGLWEHSFGCAIIARKIAEHWQVGEVEEVAVGGLLHDVGKVILSIRFPEEYKNVVAMTAEKGMFVSEAEHEVFGATHAKVGTWLAHKWNFPRNLIQIIDYAHKPQLAQDAQMQASIVHLADILVRGWGVGFPGDRLVPAVNTDAWRSMPWKDPEEEIHKIMVESDPLLMQIGELFEGND